jgi:hypothetical protein
MVARERTDSGVGEQVVAMLEWYQNSLEWCCVWVPRSEVQKTGVRRSSANRCAPGCVDRAGDFPK